MKEGNSPRTYRQQLELDLLKLDQRADMLNAEKYRALIAGALADLDHSAGKENARMVINEVKAGLDELASKRNYSSIPPAASSMADEAFA